jgi:hypothetical protein
LNNSIIKIIYLTFLSLQLVYAKNNLSFENDIKPIIDKRCVVCHSCYNSPCQLKLSSLDSLLRGATKEAIYDNRLIPAKPSRMFIDAQNQKEWQELGFYSVLQEFKNNQNIVTTLLEQKQNFPQNIGDYAPEEDKLTCSKNQQELEKYLSKNPYHGMPYGFPALDMDEHEKLTKWFKSDIENNPASYTLPKDAISFEKFLNTDDIKHQVSARYIYEHLFLAHLKFENDDFFYYLVRSYDKDGDDVVKTRVPYGDAKAKIYYKIKKITSTIVHKTHMVYEVDANILKRYKELFIDAPWDKKPYMPSFDKKISSNPLASFEQIPADARYKFMLDNIHYFIMTFIRGPVCKGQVALNVINDHFWVAFKKPEFDYTIKSKEFLKQNQKNLSLPNEYGGDTDILEVVDIYKYKQDTIDYYKNKNKLYKQHNSILDMNSIWRGNRYKQKDNDAILTIYRHFDSASVHKGALGNIPRTMWVIDYPLLERLYYSLVAGFDVYGNTQHKVMVRKYMDRLRIEGESNLLEYLPKDIRRKTFDSWYIGTLAKFLTTYTPSQNDVKTSYKYKTLVKEILNYTDTKTDKINYVENEKSHKIIYPKEYKSKQDIEQALKNLTLINEMKKFRKYSSNNFNLIYIKFEINGEKYFYTMVVNRWHDSVAFMFIEKERLDFQKDTINFIDGFVGSYPNYFVSVKQNDIKEFFNLIQNEDDQTKLSKFFINRNHKEFWSVYDDFQKHFYIQDPIKAGLFDLNRYYKKSYK